MQTTNLPLQLNTAISGSTAAQRSNAGNGANSAGQFSAMLSNELALAQPQMQMMPAPAPAPPAPSPSKQVPSAQADQAAQSDDASTTQQSATTTSTGNGTKQADASAQSADKSAADKSSADKNDDDDAHKATDPASAMLALMASLHHTTVKASAGAKGTAQAADALSGSAGKGSRTDAAQLAALQGALKSSGKEAADAKAAGDAAKDAAVADAKASDKAAGADALSAALADQKAGHKATLDDDALSLQQARDAAQQASRQDPSAMAAAALAQATQPAALDAAQAAAASEQLSAQVGTDAWENQVGQKVVYMIGNEEQTASLTLNPPDLGPMQVVLSVSNDQANVTFSSNQLEVRQALENALPRLREMMGESGIALGNATVNAGTQDQRQAQQDSSSRGGRNYGNAGTDGVAGVDTAGPRVTRTAVLGDNGMVDTFA